MRYVAISIHGRCFQAVADTLPGEPACIFANATIEEPTVFERIELDRTLVAFRQAVGGYLSVQSAGDLPFLGVADRLGDDEAFTEVRWPDGRVSLMGSNGLFVCAEGGGGSLVVVDRAEAGHWETFAYEQPPVELVAAQRRAEPTGGDTGGAPQVPRQVGAATDAAAGDSTLPRPS